MIIGSLAVFTESVPTWYWNWTVSLGVEAVSALVVFEDAEVFAATLSESFLLVRGWTRSMWDGRWLKTGFDCWLGASALFGLRPIVIAATAVPSVVFHPGAFFIYDPPLFVIS